MTNPGNRLKGKTQGLKRRDGSLGKLYKFWGQILEINSGDKFWEEIMFDEESGDEWVEKELLPRIGILNF